jgi:hypothetical protein
MRRYLFLPSLILPAVLFYMPTSGVSEGELAELQQLPETLQRVISLSEQGISPSQITIKKEDRVAYFVNNTKNSDVDLEINFGAPQTPCSSENLAMGDDGVVRSTRPVSPNQFAGTCFRDRGTYNFTVFGLSENLDGVKGSIIVE